MRLSYIASSPRPAQPVLRILVSPSTSAESRVPLGVPFRLLLPFAAYATSVHLRCQQTVFPIPTAGPSGCLGHLRTKLVNMIYLNNVTMYKPIESDCAAGRAARAEVALSAPHEYGHDSELGVGYGRPRPTRGPDTPPTHGLGIPEYDSDTLRHRPTL